MLRRILIVGGACLGAALMVSPALGQRSIPKKANKYQATLVQGVVSCTAANTTAPGVLATPACDPVVPNDDTCVYLIDGDKFKGGGQAKSKAKDDVAVQVKLKGLDPACEGLTLCAVADVEASYDTCASSGTCTGERNEQLPLGVACCVVEKGKCQVKTTINAALPGALVNGVNTEFMVGRVGMLRTTGGGTISGPAFISGLLLP